MLTLPTFEEESKLWEQGYDLVIGVDEVGRGCFAGPVVAGAVAFTACHPERSEGSLAHASLTYVGDSSPLAQNDSKIKIDDSKKLKPNEREKASIWIRENCLAYGIGEVGVETINKVGIGKATMLAMRQAAYSLLHMAYRKKNHKLLTISDKPFLLIDAFYVLYTKGIPKIRQEAIKKGDQKSISIAAASIVAKVYRDSLMQKLSRQHPDYQWGSNKGYGTRDHQEAIIKNGVTSFHRTAFVETFLSHQYHRPGV